MTTKPGNVQDTWARYKLGVLEAQIAGLGSFDPNEDPVIIGSGATGGGGSTPGNLAGSAVFITAVGPGASATGDSAAAYGLNTAAAGLSAFAGGDSASASGNGALAMALSAVASGTFSTAAGASASATATNASAFGTVATAAFARSTAVGHHSATTAIDQIMLGRSADTVVIPGVLDASHFPTTNPGAGSGLVWNNGGVLTVA